VLIALGVWQFFRGDWVGGVWSGLIGLFLNNAARSSYQQVLVRQALQGERVRRFMTPRVVTVPPTLDLLSWVEDYVYRYDRKSFPVVTGDHLEGVIDTAVLSKVPRSEWAQHTVGEVIRRDLSGRTISPDTDAFDALSRMQPDGRYLLVTEGGRLVGIVTSRDLLRFLRLKLELDGADAQQDGSGEGVENLVEQQRDQQVGSAR
jgi:CBS domain-containing protein